MPYTTTLNFLFEGLNTEGELVARSTTGDNWGAFIVSFVNFF